MTNLGICQNSSEEEQTLSKSDTILLVENGLIMIEDTSGVTYIAMDFENLNYVIKLLEEGKYDKKKINKLKKISGYWRKESGKKDEIIAEKDKQIGNYIEIRVEQDSIISALEKNFNDMQANYTDCEEKNLNKDKEIENKDAEIKTKDKKIGRKNKTIVGVVVIYVLTVLLLI